MAKFITRNSKKGHFEEYDKATASSVQFVPKDGIITNLSFGVSGYSKKKNKRFHSNEIKDRKEEFVVKLRGDDKVVAQGVRRAIRDNLKAGGATLAFFVYVTPDDKGASKYRMEFTGMTQFAVTNAFSDDKFDVGTKIHYLKAMAQNSVVPDKKNPGQNMTVVNRIPLFISLDS